MLINIPPIIPPELLKTLCEMGHGDTIVLADGNFPGVSVAKAAGGGGSAGNNGGDAALIRCDGVGVPELLRAILALFPLDTYVDEPVTLMGVAKGTEQVEVPIWDEFYNIVSAYDKRGRNAFRTVERFDFYEEAKQAFAVVATSESARYANIILKKGVVIND
ncbi:MAG: fucose isomerase [Oscillospiraceae bacterium]|nr:fucose isomerase [Oscillospiraceae bacterium]